MSSTNSREYNGDDKLIGGFIRKSNKLNPKKEIRFIPKEQLLPSDEEILMEAIRNNSERALLARPSEVDFTKYSNELESPAQ